MAAPLSYLLITANDIELKKLNLSDMQNVMTVFNTFTANDKYSPLNRDNLTQLFQKIFSQN